MTTDEQKEKLAEALGATRTGTYCQRCGWATDADGERFRTAAAAPFPCVAPCDGSANGFGPHHSSPESDPQALRYELDGCRAEIERLRAERAADPLAAILRAVWPDVEAQRWSDTYNGRDPLRSMVADGVLTLEQAGIVEVLLAAPSPVLGESGEGT